MQVATDAAGRFRLNGIGRNRLVRLQLDGPTIVSQHLCILTRPSETFEVIVLEGQPAFKIPRIVTTYYGNDFRLAASPTKPIGGVVRDRDTKKPLAGVTIRSRTIGMVGFDMAQTTTDAEGRYRLTGMPKADDCAITALPSIDQPYGTQGQKIANGTGLEAVTVDFELKRGIWIEGKITDKVTGKPIKTSVEYSAVKGNPFVNDYLDLESTWSVDERVQLGKDYGSYRVLSMPGPGLIAVYPPNDHYLKTAEREDEFGKNGIEEPGMAGVPTPVTRKSTFAALARIDPAKGSDTVHQNITLDPGWTFTGTVLDPDRKPLAGSLILYPNGGQVIFEAEQMKTSEFTAWFNPKRPRAILLRHAERGLVGLAQPPKTNGGSVTVRMEPGATVNGRLVDTAGQPQSGIAMRLLIEFKDEPNWPPHPPYEIITDAQGRFTLTGLFPGYQFSLSNDKGELSFGEGLRSGETKNLGDVRLKNDSEVPTKP